MIEVVAPDPAQQPRRFVKLRAMRESLGYPPLNVQSLGSEISELPVPCPQACDPSP